ncbi:hypothetical protein AVEN_234357-1 [Araneus ventricosus]|uniref:Uncharacterized protein n=1 Tax=Araneus ventricosus TaxID=182803 RepID=A0A4Y2A8G3_ARAVE|nr:hypothetical protein AVEN_234357-1 [Araneus ventricosus]
MSATTVSNIVPIQEETQYVMLSLETESPQTVSLKLVIDNSEQLSDVKLISLRKQIFFGTDIVGKRRKAGQQLISVETIQNIHKPSRHHQLNKRVLRQRLKMHGIR